MKGTRSGRLSRIRLVRRCALVFSLPVPLAVFQLDHCRGARGTRVTISFASSASRSAQRNNACSLKHELDA